MTFKKFCVLLHELNASILSSVQTVRGNNSGASFYVASINSKPNFTDNLPYNLNSQTFQNDVQTIKDIIWSHPNLFLKSINLYQNGECTYEESFTESFSIEYKQKYLLKKTLQAI